MEITKEVLERVADRVRYLLYLRDMTQTDLANKSNSTQANVSLILNKKKTDIKLSTLVSFAEAFDVDIKVLFMEKNPVDIN